MDEDIKKEFFHKMEAFIESIKSKVTPKEAIILLITYVCNISYRLSKEKSNDLMKDFLKLSIDVSYDSMKEMYEKSSEV